MHNLSYGNKCHADSQRSISVRSITYIYNFPQINNTNHRHQEQGEDSQQHREGSVFKHFLQTLEGIN